MKVLIGGEFSGTIRDAFLAEGFDAISCDLKETTSPGPHYKGNWEDIQGNGFDLAIFHRTCTFMANSGAKHLYNGMNKKNGINQQRFLNCMEDAWAFWNHIETCPIPFVAWENPIMIGYAQLMVGKPNQTVQPWWFGDAEDGKDNVKKATCWWLKNLPKLKRTGTLDGTTAREETFMMAPTKDPEIRRMTRSVTPPGTAKACARQWGNFVKENLK